jgi:hypothetical protein
MLQLLIMRAQLCIFGTRQRIAIVIVAYVLTHSDALGQRCIHSHLTTFFSGHAPRQQQLLVDA